MVVAFSAPITAMTGNVPVAVGWGNGIGAPAGFMVATLVLTIFSVGFTALAKHITAAGAFYTFVSRGLAKPPGLAAGMLSMLAYMTMEAALAGIFSYYAVNAFNPLLGLDIPWLAYGLLAVLIMSILSYRDIALASKILAVVLVAELALLFAMSFGVLFAGGGPDGLMPEAVNPLNAFSTNGLAMGSVGVGLLFAFWSWVGFESTAIYGEESTNPRKVVPRATMIAVIGIGITYTFISWAMVAGNGAEQAVALAQSENPMELAYTPMRNFVGEWGVLGMEWIVLGGSFACALAIHNSAARYLFAFGRDGILPHRLGVAHSVHQSPAVASVFQTLFAAIILTVCYFTGVDPYGELFVLVAIMATVNLMVAQSLTSASVISYFHVKKQHPETASWWRTLVAPIIGGVGMLYVVFTLLTNMSMAAGAAAETPFGQAIPWIVLTVIGLSVIAALIWRSQKSTVYERIGSTVFTEAQHKDLDPLLPASVVQSSGHGVMAIMEPQPRAVSGVLHWAADYASASGQELTLAYPSKAAHNYISEKWATSFARTVAPKIRLAANTRDEDSVAKIVTQSFGADMLVVSAQAALSGVIGAHNLSAPIAAISREGLPLPGPSAPVVVGIDPYGSAKQAIGFAAILASRFNAPITLVGVYGSEQQVLSAYTPSLTGKATKQDIVELLKNTADQIKAFFPYLQIHTKLTEGDARKVLADNSTGAGALVVGSRGLDAFTALFSGSLSTSLLTHVDCPVVIVPAIGTKGEEVSDDNIAA
jgi:amino acid transporter/nucleotide-binding universal stress UspA family protein